jgi:nucleoid DNA-binding protein
MNQTDLVKAVADQTGITNADTERTLKALGEVTQAELKQGGEVTMPGLGKFSVTAKPARTGRNPQTGEAIQIAAKTHPSLAQQKH